MRYSDWAPGDVGASLCADAPSDLLRHRLPDVAPPLDDGLATQRHQLLRRQDSSMASGPMYKQDHECLHSPLTLEFSERDLALSSLSSDNVAGGCTTGGLMGISLLLTWIWGTTVAILETALEKDTGKAVVAGESGSGGVQRVIALSVLLSY